MDKELRKKLGLPIKKDIVYYPNKREKQTEKVAMIEIADDFSDSEHILVITTDTGRHVAINSGFLRNMQSPHFVEEMIESDKQGETL